MQEVYERDMEQRLQELIDERMDRVVEQLTDRMAIILGNQNRRRAPAAVEIDEEEEEYEEEVPHRHPRVAVANDDRRRWELECALKFQNSMVACALKNSLIGVLQLRKF